MLRKLIVTLLLASLLITHATATEYYTKSQLELVQIDGSGNRTWSTPVQLDLNLAESKTLYGVTVNYYDIGNSNTAVFFRITGGDIIEAQFSKNEQRCLKGSCASTNSTPNNAGDVRMKLLDILPRTTSSLNGTTAENPISGYVYVNPKEISLIKDDIASVDVQKVRTDTGVSYTKTTSEVTVYFIRKPNIPISISVKAESRAPKNEEWTSDRVKFTIDSSGTYTFTIKYTKNNAWGAETDITETYGLKLINLGDGASATGGVSKYKSTIYLPDSLTVNMGTAGSFTQREGVSITSQSTTEYRLSFDSEGVYTLKYTTSGGTAVDDAVVATVRKAVQATPQATEKELTEEELTANQQQDGKDGGGLSSYYGIIFAVLIGICVVWYSLTRKKSGGTYVNPD